MFKQLIDELLARANQPGSDESQLTWEGQDPIFPTRFRFGEAGAAAIAAGGLTAARIWESRTGVRQNVHVPIDAAAASMRSGFYLKIEPMPDQPAGDVTWNPRGKVGLGAFWTRDGRMVYLQRQFEYHRQRQEAVLNCEDERESMAAAIAQWDGQALEDAILAAGACAGLVRSEEEWRNHDQAKAIARLPLLEIEKIGDSPPEAWTAAPIRPLSGVRVLDLTRVLAGPTAGRTLAEHGADVLRIGSRDLLDDRTQAVDTGHGKRAAHLDLGNADDVSQLHELIREADVFSQAFRPGALEARGLGPEAVAKLRPGIVYVTLSAFGHEGPWANRRGFDSIVQNVSGIALANGKDGMPRATPNPLDYCTGYLAAFGAMVALQRRSVEGGSYRVRVSLAQTGHWIQGLPRLSDAEFSDRPTELPEERIRELTTTYEGPLGRVTHLRPVAQMSLTASDWEHPAVPIGFNKPVWNPR